MVGRAHGAGRADVHGVGDDPGQLGGVGERGPGGQDGPEGGMVEQLAGPFQGVLHPHPVALVGEDVHLQEGVDQRVPGDDGQLPPGEDALLLDDEEAGAQPGRAVVGQQHHVVGPGPGQARAVAQDAVGDPVAEAASGLLPGLQPYRHHGVVLKALAHGQVADDLDPEPGQGPGRPDPGAHEDGGRVHGAGAEDDLPTGGHPVPLATGQPNAARPPPRVEENGVDVAVAPDLQVGTIPCRLQVAVVGGDPAPVADVHGEGTDAGRPGRVVVRAEGEAGVERGLAEGQVHPSPALPRLPVHRHRAAAPVVGLVAEVVVVLGPDERGQDVLEGPALRPPRRPSVVVLGYAPDGAQPVDGGAPPHPPPAPIGVGFLDRVAPGRDLVPPELGVQVPGHVDLPGEELGRGLGRAEVGAGLQQQHPGRAVLAEPGGQGGPGRAGADHDVVPALAVAHRPRRGGSWTAREWNRGRIMGTIVVMPALRAPATISRIASGDSAKRRNSSSGVPGGALRRCPAVTPSCTSPKRLRSSRRRPQCSQRNRRTSCLDQPRLAIRWACSGPITTAQPRLAVVEDMVSAMLSRICSGSVPERLSTGRVPRAKLAVVTLAPAGKPRSTCSGSQGLSSSFSAMQKQYLPGVPWVPWSNSPERMPRALTTTSRIARPTTALARWPGPKTLAPELKPSSRRMGPLTVTMTAWPLVLWRSAVSTLGWKESSTASRTGKCSRAQPAIAAATAASRTVQTVPRWSTLRITSSGSRPT